MKVYIEVDSEGQTCVTREPSDETVYGTFQAEYNRLRAAEETVAAVEGAREAGATDIIVRDAGFVRGHHPGGLFLMHERLPAGVRIALGSIKPAVRAAAGCDAAILLGKHAMAGVADGVMAHTGSSANTEAVWLNGERIGEIGLSAVSLGAMGIPIVMIAGDEAACREANQWIEDLELAAVKQGLNRHGAVSLHPSDGCALIRDRTCKALRRLHEFEPVRRDGPFELRTDYFTAEQADIKAAQSGAERIGERSAIRRAATAAELFRH
ncbi:MAG: hypothetical protein CMJ18_16995 [Phycisphaeraceae bacterium]|nr:hypothetical protein [Phycisphaeraceae bacterium]